MSSKRKTRRRKADSIDQSSVSEDSEAYSCACACEAMFHRKSLFTTRVCSELKAVLLKLQRASAQKRAKKKRKLVESFGSEIIGFCTDLKTRQNAIEAVLGKREKTRQASINQLRRGVKNLGKALDDFDESMESQFDRLIGSEQLETLADIQSKFEYLSGASAQNAAESAAIKELNDAYGNVVEVLQVLHRSLSDIDQVIYLSSDLMHYFFKPNRAPNFRKPIATPRTLQWELQGSRLSRTLGKICGKERICHSNQVTLSLQLCPQR